MNRDIRPLEPGAVIGILGGGQLGRMLALAAAKLGFRSHIFAPEADCPAFDVAKLTTEAAYDDVAALTHFAAGVDVITYEFENVPAETADVLARLVPVFPPPEALAIAQDRIFEKSFLRDHGLSVPDFAEIGSLQELETALATIGRPSVLKTRRFGYDGKGQVKIMADTAAGAAWEAIGEAPAILEAFVSFKREISVIVARSVRGEVLAYDVVENEHKNHILDTSRVPARISEATAQEALRVAKTIAEKIDYVGVMGVELFELANGHVMVNEIAPRVHNSGHWTMDGCDTSQFEQHIRAVSGLRLGSTARHADIIMTNLIGDDVETVPALLAETHTSVHLYGKAEPRPGRKMGHVNRLSPKA